MEIPRPPFYMKEAELVVSCSYGPGRYDPHYEEQGHDYPAAYVRWTEQRNMKAVLALMQAGTLDVAPLITHRFPVAEATAAYDLIEKESEPYLGIVLEYPEVVAERPERTLELRARPSEGTVGVGCIGAGSFASGVLLPAIEKTSGLLHPQVLCTARGLSAVDQGERFGFSRATTDEDSLFTDPEVGAVFLITRHDLHAEQVVKGLAAGKHVFVEKPLALTVDEMIRIEETLAARDPEAPVLMVGFNRRFSPAAREVKKTFADVTAPLTISYRFNAGAIAPEEWPQDDRVGGGRIIGEACHAIDLVTYLTGSPPVRVFAESIGGPDAPPITDDQCFITLRHANGSVSSIGYLAGGDRAFPKERIEVFGGGRVGVIDDFREVVTTVGGKTHRSRGFQQDKGHRREIELFAQAIARGGETPIPWKELRAVSLAAILAVRSLREGVPFDVPR
jgi:predicted dehydrogenase